MAFEYLMVNADGSLTTLHGRMEMPEIPQTITDIRRASNVEPTANLSPESIACLQEEGVEITPNSWWACMQPSGGGVLGPFETRDQAIDAEIRWIESNVFRDRSQDIETITTCLIAGMDFSDEEPDTQEHAKSVAEEIARTWAEFVCCMFDSEIQSGVLGDGRGDTKPGDRDTGGKPVLGGHHEDGGLGISLDIKTPAPEDN